MLYNESVSREFVYEVVEALGDDIFHGVITCGNVEDTIVIVGGNDVAVEFVYEQCDMHDDVDDEGYAYYSFNYTAVKGDEDLFDVDVFVYNNGDVVIQNAEHDEFQYVIKAGV